MDELALLKTFRLEDVAPDGAREYARQAVAAAARHKRNRRRASFAAMLAFAAVLVSGVAYAGHELLVGDQAPPEVQQALARFAREGGPPAITDARVQDATVAAVLDSTVGRAYLFGVPGGDQLCGWVWLDGARTSSGEPDMSAVCGQTSKTFWAWGHLGHGMRVLWGHATDNVASATLVFGDRRIDVPLVHQWFFVELADEAPTEVLAYDSDGHLIPDAFHYPRPSDGDGG